MKVYVVVTRYMNGLQDEAVFSTMKHAQDYLATRDSEGKPEIMEEHVRGEIEEEGKVFTAGSYDRLSDTHFFQGIYGAYKEARKAAGEKGLVLNRGIDDRLG